jgi:N-acetylneuraminic acid mutarotase
MNKTLNYILSILLVISQFGCDDAADSPYPALTFQSKSTISNKGRASAVAFVIGDKGYVALGRNAARSGALKDCWEYNPVTDGWTEKAVFPGLGRVNGIAEAVNGKAYVGLGFDLTKRPYLNEAQLKDFWCFDPVANTWTRKADFPALSTNACVSFVIGNSIYVGFGFDGATFTNDLWKYDVATDQWKEMAYTGVTRRTGAVVCSDGEKVFFGTGYNSRKENNWWEYFPATDTWKERRAIPGTSREFGVGMSIGNRYFVATGRHFAGNLTGGHLKDDVVEYDAGKNVWYVRGVLPGGGRENAISFVINGKGYIGFGENDEGLLNDLWSFEP